MPPAAVIEKVPDPGGGTTRQYEPHRHTSKSPLALAFTEGAISEAFVPEGPTAVAPRYTERSTEQE
jgi:hypothetical protein